MKIMEKILISTKPYISFIVVTRNDNYGGDLLHRVQASFDTLLTLCEKHCLNMELIIVEWNPPEDRPCLANALRWPEPLKYCQVRIINVPREVHQQLLQLPSSDQMPLPEFVGKNVGVCRARGNYILVTNPDILFSEELVTFLSSKSLSLKCLYRTIRCDVRGSIPPGISVERQLDYCKQHITKIHGYLGSYNNKLGKGLDLYKLARGFAGYLKWRLLNFPLVFPYGNASGDFLLMHRNHWYSLHGYPEIKGPYHIDSLILYMALLRGLKQIRLRSPLTIYHPEHNRLESNKNKPFTPEVKSAFHQLTKTRRPVIFNDETWGLGKETLSERLI